MRLPTSEPAKRIHALFRRKPGTQWSEKEVRQFRSLVKARCFVDPADLALVEQYYVFERRRGAQGLHRRDLYTFLNNFQGELDRARAWRELHPLKPEPRKIIPLPPAKTEPFVPTEEEAIAIRQFETARLSRKGRLL